MIRLLIILTFSLSLSAKEISISFDDAPMGDGKYFSGKERTEKLIKALKASGVAQAIFYANPGKVTNEEKLNRLKSYQRAGHLIGNHTFDHISADKNTVEDFMESVMKADVFLKKEQLLTPYFRYPYLRRGKTISKVRSLRKQISKQGYKDGYITIDNYDWYMNHLFQKSLKANKKINLENLKKYYIEILMKSIDFYDELAIKTLSRSPKHVLLLHENDLAALFIDDLVLHLKSRGWKIINTIDSYNDPDLSVYPDILKHNQGRVASKAIEQGYTGKIYSGYEDEKVLETLYKSYGVEND